MQITFGASSLSQPTTLYKLNAHTSQVGAAASSATQKGRENRDNVTISPMGGRMEALMKQKESLNERKHALIEKTLEDGGNLTDIQEQLESFDESLKLMDEQMSDLITDALDPDSKKAESSKQDTAGDTPKTEEEAQAKRIDTFTSLAGSIESLKTTASAKSQLESRIKVLRQEMRMDKAVAYAHGENLKLSTDKADQIEEATGKLEGLSQKTGETLSDVQETLREQQTPPTADAVREQV